MGFGGVRDPDRLDAWVRDVLDGRISRYERETLGFYREALAAIRRDIAAVYERYSVDGTLTLAEMSRYNRLAALEKQIVAEFSPAVRKSTRLVEKMSRIEYDEAFYRYAWTMDQQAGVALQWGVLNPTTVTAAVANPLRLIAETRLETDGIQRIQRAVTQGLIRGQSYPAMAREIKAAIDGNASDALRIVRTEGQRAQVIGQQASYERARADGVVVVDVWNASLDGRTRPEHGALDGVEAKYDDAGNPYWDTAVGRVAGPTRSGVASFDINCRCRITGRVKGYEPTVRRIRGQGVVPYTTYDNWIAGLNARGKFTA